MSEAIMEDEKSGAATTAWTQTSLQQLLDALKRSLPKNGKTKTYFQGLKAVDWDKVAFPPFTAEECQEKWKSMMAKMRRYRTLPELLDEAEHAFSDPDSYQDIHPELPKKPVFPKMAYIGGKLSRYSKKHPGMSAAQIMKMLAKMYDELPDKQKDKYVRNYNVKYNEYRRSMQNFRVQNGRPHGKVISQRSSPEEGGEGCSKDEGLPNKPPVHGRALFIKEHCKADASSFGSGFMKVIGQRWKEMSNKEKHKYNRRCKEMKKEYEDKLIRYLDRLDKKEREHIIKEKGIKMPKKTLGRHVRQPGEPKRPCLSGFIYFYSEKIKQSSDRLPQKEYMRLARNHWRELPTSEKSRYAEIVKGNMREYRKDLQKWFQTLSPEEQRNYLERKNCKSINTFLQGSRPVQKEANQQTDEESEDE